MADEVRPRDIGRRRGDRAVDRRRQAAAVAGEGAAEIGHQRVTLPIRHREKFRCHHPERQTFRHDGAAGIGVIAGADLDRRLDQKTAGVIADRAERIVIDLQPLARRLAHHGAGHRGRQRCLVGGLRRRDRQPQLPGGVELRRWRRRAAGTGRRFRLRLTRIKLRLLAGAIERVISGIGRAAGRWQAILRDLPDPRRRRPAIGVERLVIAAGVVGIATGRGPAQRQILRRHEAALHRAKQIGRDALGLGPGRVEGDRCKVDQPKACQRRA